MNDEFRKMVTGAFDEVFESTKQKPTKSDWEQNADKLQQKEQQELEQLNTQARYNFNKKQYEQSNKQKTEPITQPTLLDLLE